MSIFDRNFPTAQAALSFLREYLDGPESRYSDGRPKGKDYGVVCYIGGSLPATYGIDCDVSRLRASGVRVYTLGKLVAASA